MESNYRNSEFEQYIKENADQYRMFPSENVWKGIHGTLHTRRKWYGFGLALLLLLTGTAVTWVMVSYPVAKDQPISSVEIKPQVVTQQPPVSSREIINKALPFNNSTTTASPQQIRPSLVNNTIAPSLQNELPQLISIASPEQLITLPAERNRLVVSARKTSPEAITVSADPDFMADLFHEENTITYAPNRQAYRTYASDRPSRYESYYPLSLENVTTAYIPLKLGKKISWQWYITPTISYRKLGENKSSENSSSPGSYVFASMSSDINKAVTHKPDMGLQVGLSARYPVTKKLKIRGGLQFNINRYDIKAFAYNPEVATINLNEPDQPNGVNTLSTWTSLRTYNGFKTDWLKNYYFSVSAPIGVELAVLGNNKTSLGIAGTIQPTYIIKDKAYLISTDHKNYAKAPSLIRHVNVNMGFETFVNYISGKTRWQIGPQVRYQVLSSFQNKYPVKENLFDFGVKIGVILNE
jgi:hypothetical protein